MNVHMLSAPAGFSQATDDMNKGAKAPDMLKDLVAGVIYFLERHVGVLSPSEYALKFASAGVDFEIEELQSIINSLEYIFRAAKKFKAGPEQLQSALSLTEMDEQVIQLCVQCWTEEEANPTGSEAVAKTLKLGQLVSMDWKVGVAVTSSSCAFLRAPYVSMVMRIADRHGNTTSHAMELTLGEFQDFAKTMQEVGRTMDML